MRLLLALVLALSFSAPAPAAAQSSLSAGAVEVLQEAHTNAWYFACELKKANCKGLVRPYVGYAVLPGRLGQYINGEFVVLVDIRLAGQPVSFLLVVHEMIHYLQWVTGQRDPADPSKQLSSCAGEKEAFDLVWALNSRFQIVDPEVETRFASWDQVRGSYYGCGIGTSP